MRMPGGSWRLTAVTKFWGEIAFASTMSINSTSLVTPKVLARLAQAGLVQATFRSRGVRLPRDADEQARCGDAVAGADPLRDFAAGDLLCFGEGPPASEEGPSRPRLARGEGRITHVALADGAGYVVHASAASGGVCRSPLAGGSAEAAALRRAFGEAAARVPVTSFKSTMGQLGAGAGAVEAVAAALAAQKGVIPPTLNCENPDPECAFAIVRQTQERPVRAVLCNASSFAGQNASLVVKKFVD